MKKKDIYEVTIKIIGIVAACKFIETLFTALFVYITFHTISTNIKFDFMGLTQTNPSYLYILPFVMYGIFGYLLLFKTDRILSLLKLSDSTEATFQIDKKTFYHIVVLLIGFFMLTYSGNQLINKTFSKTEEKTTQQTSVQNPISQNHNEEKIKTIISTSTSPSTTTSTNINYINILLFLLSILILIKSERFSFILMPKEKEELIA